MKKIGVVCADIRYFEMFLKEFGTRKKEELDKFHCITSLDDLLGVELFTVLRAFPYSRNWKHKQDELFLYSIGRIR